MERVIVAMMLVLVISFASYGQTKAENKKLSASTLHREAIVVDGQGGAEFRAATDSDPGRDRAE